MKAMLPAYLLGLAAPLLVSASQQPPAAPELPEVAKHVRAATALAGSDLKAPLFLCEPTTGRAITAAAASGITQWLEPAKLFDNLYFVGNRFVGSYLLKTSDGLIMFDAGTGTAEVRDHIIPAIEKLGLDPRQIRYAIVSHGHWDHFGGALYLQQTYGTRIGLGAADWEIMEKAAPTSLELNGRPIPRRDLVLTDGQRLTLGDTSVTVYVTPGHTPGTISAIVPVRDGERTRVFSLLGSTAFPSTVGPNEHTSGLDRYGESVLRFARISARAGAAGILNNHAFADGGLDRIEAAKRAGSSRPLLVGADGVRRYYGIIHHCIRAAAIRTAADPTPPRVPWR